MLLLCDKHFYFVMKFKTDTWYQHVSANQHSTAIYMVPTSSGNHGKPGKSQKNVPRMEKLWNLKKTEKSRKIHRIL